MSLHINFFDCASEPYALEQLLVLMTAQQHTCSYNSDEDI